MNEPDKDHVTALFLDGAEEAFKQVITQLTKNYLDDTMSEQKFKQAARVAALKFAALLEHDVT